MTTPKLEVKPIEKEVVKEIEITAEKVTEPLDNIKEIIRDMKTPKYVADSFNFLDELGYIEENIKHAIESANDEIFEKHNIDGKISLDEKNIAVDCFKELVSQLNTLKNKIQYVKLKEIE